MQRSAEKGAPGAGDWSLARWWTTKIHTLTDVIGRPYALMLTAGNVSDVKAAPALLERAGRMRYLLADKGYDADRLRHSLRKAGAVPVIPGRRNRKRAIRTTKTAIVAAISSRTPSAVSRTSAALPSQTALAFWL